MQRCAASSGCKRWHTTQVFCFKWRCSCLAYGDEFYCTYPISADCGRSGPLVSLHRNKEQVKCVIFIIPALHNSTCKEQNANHLYSICLRGRCYRGTRCVCTKDQSYGTLQCARYYMYLCTVYCSRASWPHELFNG